MTNPQLHQQPNEAAQDGPPLWAPYYGVPIGTAVLRFFKKYATFSGRASRSEFWGWSLVSFGVFVALYLAIALQAVPKSDGQKTEIAVGAVVAIYLILALSLAIIVPFIALTVRRLHDSNKSGWFYLFNLIPFFGPIVLLIFVCLPADPAGQQYDRPTGY